MTAPILPQPFEFVVNEDPLAKWLVDVKVELAKEVRLRGKEHHDVVFGGGEQSSTSKTRSKVNALVV